jgi:hypothetical protein
MKQRRTKQQQQQPISVDDEDHVPLITTDASSRFVQALGEEIAFKKPPQRFF